MLFRQRDAIKEQMKLLDAEDSPYRERAGEIRKNLNAVVMFLERQIYERQILKEKQNQHKNANSERLLNPGEAARKRQRANFRFIASLSGRINEMDRLISASKSNASDSAKRDLMRRAVEISVEIGHRADLLNL
jgi:hypothetical protein